MIIPETPTNESFRIKALKSLHILDTESEKEFNEITTLAAHLCEVEVALISLVDSNREWYKSKYGISVCEIPRKYSFCAHAILTPEKPLIISDTRKDPRFHKNPFTEGDQPFIFYAGIPLIDHNGFALGTLSVIDSAPKTLSDTQISSLKALANQVIILFELNKKNKDLEKMQGKLKHRNETLKEFAQVISHDLKMPLANIITTSDVLKLKLTKYLDKETLKYFDYIRHSSFSMSTYINDVLDHYESDSLIQKEPEQFLFEDLLREILNLLNISSNCTIQFPKNTQTLNCNRLALKQILINLIGNSLKYNDKEKIHINIDTSEDTSYYRFKITDNGMGIPEEKLKTIFDLFATANTVDRSGNKGNGIGLSTVKKLVNNLGGSINVASTMGVQTTFEFLIKK
ncbi:GAF domain-containing sensor histidine kinase [Aquimarina sp. TRL1]|uniref:GAF domain-containing sensor histidine kinase n=1 Tax=Aquimarina sp. (strain TRL1) TaxID=2736252 RepID=UPI00158D78AD|nr:GAF domain-containing sensor histidine kinase [Aquimarina sp. TRL1]QKX06394.1 GAF domain-containing sensor histidine kinase [Aquimarina sp. TRL1]